MDELSAMPSQKAGAQPNIVESLLSDPAKRDFHFTVRFGHFPELTIEQNRVIWEAREKGFADFWPSYPSAMSQAENTHKGAVEFLKGAK